MTPETPPTNSTPEPTPPLAQSSSVFSKLDEIISFLEVGASWAALIPLPGSAAASKLAGSLLRIIQAAIRTHEAVTGEPLDLGKLHELPPLE